jgi:transcriptional regulator GlxA family with amidase domain
MWQRLGAEAGHRVLEIGTGTGYSTALGAHCLGDAHLTSIEYDPAAGKAAAAALRAAGFAPRLIIGDGLRGDPDGGRYDRLVATCSVRYVPLPWLHQVKPGGKILVTLSGWSYANALALLDVTGPVEVFSTATRFLPDAGYRTLVVSAAGGPVAASCGLAFETVAIGEVGTDVDTLVVAGGADMEAPGHDEHLVHELRRLARRARRVASVCSGAFLLAEAGLLDGKRATTHWGECRMLAAAYPSVTVDPDAIYVRDGDVWTSAGVTAGIDLSLALLADDHGRQAAATVARQLVVYLRRSGGQSQFSRLLAAQAADSEPIQELLTWIADHLADDLSVPALAARVHLSERQFRRVFGREVGRNPVDHVETVRIDAACSLLETTDAPIGQIARECGFGAPETMNRSFRRRLNTTPGDHRQHFGGATAAG